MNFPVASPTLKVVMMPASRTEAIICEVTFTAMDYLNSTTHGTGGFNVDRSTDDTYLQRYDISNQDILTSRLFLEGVGQDHFDRTYALVEALSFQGLRVGDDPGTTPLILPMVEFAHETPLSFMGSKLRFSGNLLSLTRDEASNSQRISTTGEWVVPYNLSSGHLFTLTSRLRGDLYYISNRLEDPTQDEQDTVARIIPEMALNWKYPLVRYDRGSKNSH